MSSEASGARCAARAGSERANAGFALAGLRRQRSAAHRGRSLRSLAARTRQAMCEVGNGASGSRLELCCFAAQLLDHGGEGVRVHAALQQRHADAERLAVKARVQQARDLKRDCGRKNVSAQRSMRGFRRERTGGSAMRRREDRSGAHCPASPWPPAASRPRRCWASSWRAQRRQAWRCPAPQRRARRTAQALCACRCSSRCDARPVNKQRRRTGARLSATPRVSQAALTQNTARSSLRASAEPAASSPVAPPSATSACQAGPSCRQRRDG